MQEPIIEQVTAALELARLAVDADTNEDYGMAIRKYRETIFSMEKVKERISQDGARALLAEKLQKYKQRLELLEGLFPSLSANPTVGGASRPPPSRPPPSFQPPYSPTPVQPTQPPATTNFTPATTPTTPAPVSTPAPAPTPTTTTPTATTPSVPPWKRDPSLAAPPPPVSTTPATNTNSSSSSIFFVEEEINFTASKSLDPPDSLNQRTFWLIHLLHQTMTTGGFLTPKLYVSTTVWDQKGAKFSAVQTKISCLQSVLEGLCKLSNVDVNNSDEGLRQFEEFCGVLNGAQNMLAKHLSFIKESKDEKKGIFKSVGTGMARLKTGLSSASTDDSYVVVLRETLAKATVFDRWLAKYENGSNKALWELLSRVCDFFYSVVISFVIRDFNMLLVRYMKKCNESFFED